MKKHNPKNPIIININFFALFLIKKMMDNIIKKVNICIDLVKNPKNKNTKNKKILLFEKKFPNSNLARKPIAIA
ncbi:hypothetical protein FIT92_04090 [Candidatus Methylopumilus universalis]|uniref:Uncharacterized protein n=1 Tax=Candidatus Methylopumilus universalis TaxID=2588536 RepID=A0AAX1F0F2_9PROT|nr:hypothetical protein [Candidatus Methylopumilus universalis]QDC41241.1 hypothetical protein FIT94_04090 [Candidatus Methylopumilus universalis]QDC42531.1 hypothetical protein FIT95_04095 [Candidatus Methylopumilus universalis]QDC54917.1 hypothetical protein FIT97_04090 [Candidatus Methylopumilus universalis]QDC56198.1 hypothetical protein FIT98_04095 [Candidatus Methylopumilus universalis]QDC57480.1 hypothetical protein FIT96_04090 [Candidatus Methylopumilus universalis]